MTTTLETTLNSFKILFEPQNEEFTNSLEPYYKQFNTITKHYNNRLPYSPFLMPNSNGVDKLPADIKQCLMHVNSSITYTATLTGLLKQDLNKKIQPDDIIQTDTIIKRVKENFDAFKTSHLEFKQFAEKFIQLGKNNKILSLALLCVATLWGTTRNTTLQNPTT